ncbi:MAG: hypothetical protein HYW48_01320 [Deltaproteobacteria bacterium]|nr:hypothetical protein [Deltaproteobacteria bacterium]
MKNSRQLILILLLHVSLCYTYAFLSFLGPLIVLVTIALIIRSPSRLGFSWTKLDALSFVLTGIVTALLAFYLGRTLDITLWYHVFSGSSIAYILGQTLCEEICLGFLPMQYLAARIVGFFPRFVTVIAMSLTFAIGHQLLYTHPWRIQADPLNLSAIIGLFLFGALRFFSYLVTKKIAIAWGIHLTWNLFFIAPDLYHRGELLKEPQRFRLLFGEPLVFVTLIGALGIVLLAGARRRLQT